MNVEIPEKLESLFDDSFYRYNILYGGRGGGKSWAVALRLILKAMQHKSVILCTREVQRTIKDSVRKLLVDTIERYKLDGLFEVQKDKITCIKTGSIFIFTGLQNPAGINSIEGITDCWIEEAAKVTFESFKFLIPTIRQEDSKFYIVFNPDDETDPVNDLIKNPRPQTNIININYNDNPFFPDVLRQEMEYDKEHDYDYYAHVWEGHYWSKSDDQVMAGVWKVQGFDSPANIDYYYGADFGFSKDPSAGIRCFIIDKNLYIDYECYGFGVENEKLIDLFKQLPDIDRNVCRADNSRPETIDYIKRHGLPLFKSAKKGKGSIEDGISFIRSHNVIIHPRCVNTINEFKFYRYKKNIADEVTRVIIDKHNHILDSLRYGLESANKSKFIQVLR